MNIRLLECDDKVQKDIWLRCPEDIESYGEGFEAVGGYGTDYRPVFSHVAKLRKEGLLPGLKGLFYFTDGYGVYPSVVTDYDTAFVFARGEDIDDTGVPDWAMKVYF